MNSISDQTHIVCGSEKVGNKNPIELGTSTYGAAVKNSAGKNVPNHTKERTIILASYISFIFLIVV